MKGRGRGHGGRGRGHGGRGRGHGGRGRAGGGGDIAPPAPGASSAPEGAPEPTRASIVPDPLKELRMQLETNLSHGEPSSSSVSKGALAPASSMQIFRRPPEQAILGDKCRVRANHFLVGISADKVTKYKVTLENCQKNVNREVIIRKAFDADTFLTSRYFVYDGQNTIYTAGSLSLRGTLSRDVYHNGRSIGVTFEERAPGPDLWHLQQFLRGEMGEFPQETLQVLNMVLRKSASINSIVDNLLGSGEHGNGLERAYHQSLCLTQMGLSLNIDILNKGFYEPILVSDFVSKYLNLGDRDMTDEDLERAQNALKGVKVQTSYGRRPRKFKIRGLTKEALSELRLNGDGRKLVVEYFGSTYHRTLQLTHLPALEVGTIRKPVYLPMELCTILDGQRFPTLRSQTPSERQYGIEWAIKKNNYSERELLKREFRMTVHEGLTEVDARVLAAPQLKYLSCSEEKEFTVVRPENGAWNMQKMVDGAAVMNWACISFSERLEANTVVKFCRLLIDKCISRGMTFEPDPIVNPILKATDIKSTLRYIQEQSQIQRKQLQIVIVVLPDAEGSYGVIKKISETEFGIISQCCEPVNVKKMNKATLENLSLKINAKVGGRNTCLSNAVPKVTSGIDNMTIIFGADVTHPAPGKDPSPSIAAVVASMDWPEMTKYQAVFSAQNPWHEIIEDLYKPHMNGKMIRELLCSFREKHDQVLPKRIIFYRDGVSENQFDEVLTRELAGIRKACLFLEPDYRPTITFVVVAKRHHTRLFPCDHEMDYKGNIRPGTIVDTQICHPFSFDFYLNSHAGKKGCTNRPAHYYVLHDENKFTIDEFQRFTYDLCHTNVRCNNTLSIVPPVHYAHLAASRARFYIESDNSNVASTSRGTGTGTRVRKLATVHTYVKDKMFFC